MALTARTIKSILANAKKDLAARGKPCRDHLHGDGLMLRVSIGADNEPSGLWLYRYMLNSKRSTMSLGRYQESSLADGLSLADALKIHEVMRAKVKSGTDPLTERQLQKATKVEQVKAVTFKEFALEYIKQKSPEWKNAKHAQQWTNTLTAYAFPYVGNKLLDEITTNDIELLLLKIWASKPETASRVQMRLECVINAARVRGLRTTENPARWKNHLKELLPKKTNKSNQRHHPALEFERMPDFWKLLQTQADQSSRLMQFVILTACRSGEARSAVWSEINLDAALWTIPASRTKTKKTHEVPLSVAALALVKTLPRVENCDLVFPSPRRKVLSDSAARQKLIELGAKSIENGGAGWQSADGDLITLHGFRSTFRDWAAETTPYPNFVVEMALAHAVGNAVEAAYRRGSLLDKRRSLMQDWSSYVTGTEPPNNADT